MDLHGARGRDGMTTHLPALPLEPAIVTSLTALLLVLLVVFLTTPPA